MFRQLLWCAALVLRDHWVVLRIVARLDMELRALIRRRKECRRCLMIASGAAVLLSLSSSCSGENDLTEGAEAAGWRDGQCVPTIPNADAPPGEHPSPTHHGNGRLWLQLPPNGVVHPPPTWREPDGSIRVKFPWWRGVEGILSIRGRRLDESAPPLRARIPSGYGTTGFQSTALFFPTEGCWAVTGAVGTTRLTIVIDVRSA